MSTYPSPAFSMIYDHFVDSQAHRAQEIYTSLLPSIATSDEIKDAELLDQLAVVERILHAVSTAFKVTTSEGIPLHQLYRNDNARQSTQLAHVVGAFTYLNALLRHPAYQMLATVRAVVGRNKSLGALRDIRWIFRAEHAGLIFTDEACLFKELTANLHQLVQPHNPSFLSPIAKQAIKDFTGYLFDEDHNVMVNSINFGTACVLAQSAVESVKRT